MSNYIRPRVPGATIFFTVALAHRGSTLLVDEIDRLRAAVGLTRKRRPFHVDAWVVLPDHMHCVWTLPKGDADFSTRWGAIKTRFSRSVPCGTRRISHISRRERGIWQRRFWEHHIRDATDWRNHVRYCHINPVKHGYVERPEEWPYSTVHRHIEKNP